METNLLLTMYGGLGMIALAMVLFKWNSLRKKKAEHWKPSETDPQAAPVQIPNPEPEAKTDILGELGLPKPSIPPAAQEPEEEEGLFAKELPLEPEPKEHELPPARKIAPPIRTLKCKHCGKTFENRYRLKLHKNNIRQKQEAAEVK